MMKKCLLCKVNEADKTGSHIIPHFIQKRVDNEPNQKGRDKELGFVIGAENTTSYFGRGVQPDKLEETYGKITEELIENNNVKGVVDHYFCSPCENRFGVVENEYSKTLNITKNLGKNHHSTQPFIGFLFWISIVWRLSIQEKSGFKLKTKDENKLARILNKYMHKDISKIIPNGIDSDLNSMGYKLLRSPNFSNENETIIHWSPYFKTPYSFMIDEFLLFLYFKKTHVSGVKLDFFGTEREKENAYLCTPFNGETVLSLSFDRYREIISKIFKNTASKRLHWISNLLDKTHVKLGGTGNSMDPELKEEIIKRIANSESPLGKAHTTKDHIEIISKTIDEFMKMGYYANL